jgi:DNA polymerase-3 subunit gamma/tau
MDVAEIDGASNRGIDAIRQLREGVAFSPARDRFKVYIIDEVHMLTTEAFNALLKTLEEPPPHVVFIFATTERHKVPATILSRCQVFEFRRIALKDLVERLSLVCKTEGFENDEEALLLLAREADGSLRDALSLLDQVVAYSFGKVTHDVAVEVLKSGYKDLTQQTFFAILRNDVQGALRGCVESLSSGMPARVLLRDLSRLCADCLKLVVLGKDAGRDFGWTEQETSALLKACEGKSAEYLASVLNCLVKGADDTQDSKSPDLLVQSVVVRTASLLSIVEIQDIVARVEDMIEKGDKGEIRVGLAPPSRAQVEAPKAPEPKTFGEPQQTAVSKQESAQDAQEALLSRFKAHPVVEKAIKVFDAEIVQVSEQRK